MIVPLFLFWVVGMIVCWIMIMIHEVLVNKYQPELKDSNAHKRDVMIITLLSVIPIINWILSIRFIYNIATYKVPEEPEE